MSAHCSSCVELINLCKCAEYRVRCTFIAQSYLLYVFSLFQVFIHSAMALQPFVGPSPLLQFRNLFYTVGRTPWTSDQPDARPLPTHRTAQTQNKHNQTSMPRVRFDPRIPVFERTKTFHALHRLATVIGSFPISYSKETSLFSARTPDILFCTSLNERGIP
jgi:hypothetical protein